MLRTCRFSHEDPLEPGRVILGYRTIPSPGPYAILAQIWAWRIFRLALRLCGFGEQYRFQPFEEFRDFAVQIGGA